MTEKERIEQKVIFLNNHINDLYTELNDLKNAVEAFNNDDSWKPKGTWSFDSDLSYNTVNNVTYPFKDNDYNRFNTEEEALKISKKINAWLKLYHIAKYLNGDWEPDWHDRDENKYYLYCDSTYAKIATDWCTTVKNINDIFFKSKELVEKAIKLMGDDINYLFDKGVNNAK